MKILRRLCVLGTVAFLGGHAFAGLNIPYAVDANTLHLWHFDGPTNTITTTDEVQTVSIELTNSAGGTTLVTLGNASAITQLGGALQIIPPSLTSGSANGFAVNRTSWPDTTPFMNPESGAFTMEAVVRCTGNPYLVNGNWEIIAGDSGNGSRSWQFRIQSGSSPVLNFNFITGGGNYSVGLPKSGPNVLLQGIWYHVAVAYTGNAPTNGDTAGILTMYWTVLDGGRTNASILTNITTTASTLGGNPILGIGGSARTVSGVANGEGFKGFIDEVRISDIYRGSNQMAFAVGGAATPPAFLQQPPTNTLVGYGKTLTLPALAAGAPTFYWFHDGTNLPAQTDSSLLIPNVTFADAGSYRLIASNSLDSVTSVVAQVTVGAAFSELFATGINTNSDLAEALSVDPHYTLYRSANANNFGPDALVWNMEGFPIAQFGAGGTFANPDGVSQWIGDQAANLAAYTSPTGQYIYRTTFLLDSVDLSQPVTLSGVWYVNESGDNILINGQSTGFSNSAANSASGRNPANFTITNKFVPGLNTLDFMTTRLAGQPESALRVQMSGIGLALAPGLPVITNQPANVTVRENGKASFSVVALGRPPLSYQWYADNALLTDATNRTLAFNPVTTGGQGANFRVIISNDSGSVTSQVAVLTLTTNRPPVPPAPINAIVYSPGPLNLSIADIIYGSTDADNDPITLASFDGASTNGGAIVQPAFPDNINLVYTPVEGYVGADQFTYLITDQIENTQGFVNIAVLPGPAFGIAKSGTNLVLSASGGVAGGTLRVLTSTNIATPLANWTVSATGNFDGSGQFSVTNAIAPGVPERFFILQAP